MACLCNSHRPSARLHDDLKRLGIAERFEFVLSSLDLGCAMPAVGCYQAALSQLKLPADDVAFIGHDPHELAGAAMAGLWTIALNHEGEIEADIALERIEQLLQAVSYRSGQVLAG